LASTGRVTLCTGLVSVTRVSLEPVCTSGCTDLSVETATLGPVCTALASPWAGLVSLGGTVGKARAGAMAAAARTNAMESLI